MEKKIHTIHKIPKKSSIRESNIMEILNFINKKRSLFEYLNLSLDNNDNKMMAFIFKASVSSRSSGHLKSKKMQLSEKLLIELDSAIVN